MSRLILMRHAKSDWGDMNLRDSDRPLNGRGRAACPLMAKALAEREWVPDMVLCSTSKRTQETFERMQEVWDKEVKVEYRDELYLASSHILTMALNRWFEKYNPETLMILAHNPGIAQLTEEFADQMDDNSAPKKFSTAACALYDGFCYKGSFTPDELVSYFKPDEVAGPR